MRALVYLSAALFLTCVAVRASDIDVDVRAEADAEADIDADADAQARGHADAGADAGLDAYVSKWDNYMLQAAKEVVGTDGEMYWLRSAHINAATGIDHAQRQHGVILVGNANMPPATRTGPFDLNPPQPPLLHADIATWIAAGGGLTAQLKNWIKRNAGAFNALTGQYPNSGVNALAFQNCEQSVKDAMAAVGQGVDDNAKAAWSLQHLFGGGSPNGQCTLNIALPQVRRWAGVIAAHPDEWEALNEHYTRLRAHANNDAYDVWALRGWLYVTERARGHRLLGATGYAADSPGPEDIGAERRFVKAKFMNPLDAMGQRVFNAPGPQHWGLDSDTCGHVRPRAFGGNLDPLNFVPQSATGQKFVNAAEVLALEMVKWCTGNAVIRYGVYFTYAGNDVRHRRPTRARTVVDITGGNCGNAHHRLGRVTPIVAADGIFDWDTPTY